MPDSEQPYDQPEETRTGHAGTGAVDMPRPTGWPIIFAAGLALTGAGLLTSYLFCGLGVIVSVFGLAGWITQLYPGAGREQEEMVPPDRRPRPVLPSRQVRPGQRQVFPSHRHPYSSGLKGGLVGGLVMAGCALLYGAVSNRTIWYPVNLLAGMVLPQLDKASVQELNQFSWEALIVGSFIHAFASLGTGFLLAVMMPMLPSWQWFWSSFIAPLVWTGVIYGFMSVLNPVLNQHVDWWWFVASQFAFGITASLVIHRSESVKVS